MFALSVDGMGLQTLEHGEQELGRLRQLKVEKMGDLMLAARARLEGDSEIRSVDVYSVPLFAVVPTLSSGEPPGPLASGKNVVLCGQAEGRWPTS